MYAVIATGGKQYKVSPGDVIRVEKLKADAGTSVDFNQVLLVANDGVVSVGAPYVDNSKVTGEVKTHGRGKKIEVIKFKRRKQYRRQMGHRQDYTEVEIIGINANGSLIGSPAPSEPVATTPDAHTPKFLDAPEGEADDLKKINGIGSNIEKILNELGIFHFHQIAGLSPENSSWINEKLSFKGRIEREEWVEQAKVLTTNSEDAE